MCDKMVTLWLHILQYKILCSFFLLVSFSLLFPIMKSIPIVMLRAECIIAGPRWLAMENYPPSGSLVISLSG